MSHHLDQSAKDCIAACNDCATECGNCFAQMVGKESENDCPACCIECAAICRLCVDAIARSSPFVKQTCKLCADIFDWCAKQSDAHDMDHCKCCAEARRRCAEACRNMAGVINAKSNKSRGDDYDARRLDGKLGNWLHGRVGRIIDDTGRDFSHCWNCCFHS